MISEIVKPIRRKYTVSSPFYLMNPDGVMYKVTLIYEFMQL